MCVLVFQGEDINFIRKVNYNCYPNLPMASTNIKDAKQECSNNTSCRMIVSRRWDVPPTFSSCSSTATIEYLDYIEGEFVLYEKGNINIFINIYHSFSF